MGVFAIEDGAGFPSIVAGSLRERTVTRVPMRFMANATAGNETAGNETAGNETAGNETIVPWARRFCG
jgi:hypothetical protein